MIEIPREARDAARTLSTSMLAQGYKPVGLYPYTNPDGSIIFYRFRLNPPDNSNKKKQIRPMHCNGNGWELEEPVFQNGKPIYARHHIANNPDAPVWVVEGEPKADALNQLGLVATTSGGATSAAGADWEPLRGRTVRIWPDNDEPGQSYAGAVENILLGLDCSVSRVDVATLGLGESEDVMDWLRANPAANSGDVDALSIFTTSPAEKSGTEAITEGADGRPTTAKVLIDLALKNCTLFHDERQDGYAVTTHNGISRTLKLRGREFKRWLAGSYYTSTGKAANNEAISTALSVLEWKATFDGRQLELSNRFAICDGVIYIDMADSKWRVIKVTADGWEIMEKPPVLFRRYAHQMPLPDPVGGGKLSDLHQHLAIKSDDDKRLIEGWLVASAFSNAPRPVPTFHGPQGASKTTSARILKSITDPSVTESVDLGKSPADLAQVLDHHGVPCFDNLTSIPSWAADMLCRAVTGGAFSKRELYSDDSDILLTFKRAMIITGINIPTHAPDLLDRLLLIELERIQPEKREDEATFWKRFEADRPKLFGALLDGIAGALKHLPSIKLARMPRMADFARIACAYAVHTGVDAKKMLDIIMQHSSRQTEEILDADPVASAIREFIQKRETWTGTAAELLKLLNESQPTPRPDGWPKQPNVLTRRLNVLHATLNDAGINILRGKEGSKRNRLLTLEKKPDSSSASSASSRSPVRAALETDDQFRPSSRVSSAPDDQNAPARSSSAPSSVRNPSIHAGLDDTDDQDGDSAYFSEASDYGVVEDEGLSIQDEQRWAT